MLSIPVFRLLQRQADVQRRRCLKPASDVATVNSNRKRERLLIERGRVRKKYYTTPYQLGPLQVMVAIAVVVVIIYDTMQIL